jgi:Peptidase propeptide and YPEB domain
MKNQSLKNGSILTLIILGFGFSTALAAEESQEALKAQAEVTQAQAEKIALGKVPDGNIESSDLEKENGKFVWSFDIVVPESKNITEVQVDAKTGEIVLVKIETPEQQAQEAKTDSESSQ